MTNKEKLKRVIEEEYDLEKCYEEIIMKIYESKQEKINKVWKWSLVPICLAALIGGGLFLKLQLNKNGLKNKPFVDSINNVTLNINEIDNKSGSSNFKLDADVKVVEQNDINFLKPFGLIDLPSDLIKTYNYIFYFRENKESINYDILGNYEIVYTDDFEREVSIKYSEDNKPIRDYYFSEEGSKITKIKEIELKIYKYENIYFTEFVYNGYNFDIETHNITEQELSNLLFSILK